MILVFGKTGQVATELQRLGDVKALDREEADLSDPKVCIDLIREHRPRAIINAAAYTAVDQAELEEPIATIINGDAPTEIAAVCAQLNIPMVHISTDYVFEGTGLTPWNPMDPNKPQNSYGRSKLLGEQGIRRSRATHAILRTSWVISAHGVNFVKTMLRMSQNHDELKIVADQIGGPTPASDIADACLQIVDQLIQDPSKSGTYHFSGSPDVSWAELAIEIFAQIGKSIKITPISTSDFYSHALRPLNSRMECGTTEQVFGIKRPCWRTGLSNILKELEVIT